MRRMRERDSTISIHASAKEATNLEIAFQKLDRLFQSTPLRRRRPSNPTIFPSLSLFQSTPPRRRRRDKIPVRSKPQDFNPRLREGGDLLSAPSAYTFLPFQSTPPRRRRLCRNRRVPQRHDFNPRLREGGDYCLHLYNNIGAISIHASAKEATLCFSTFLNEYHISIHASAKEATL